MAIRNVRNFWLDARIDGRASDLEGGPVGKTDGFTQTVYARKDGAAVVALRLVGRYAGGRLIIEVEAGDDVSVITDTTRNGQPGLMIRTDR